MPRRVEVYWLSGDEYEWEPVCVGTDKQVRSYLKKQDPDALSNFIVKIPEVGYVELANDYMAEPRYRSSREPGKGTGL